MELVKINREVLLEGLRSEVRLDELNQLIAELDGMEVGQLPGQIGKIVAWAVQEVEELVEDSRAVGDAGQYGPEKRAALISWLDEVFQCHPLLEMVDGKIIGYAVDSAVAAFNGILGKTWKKKAAPEAAAPQA